MPGTIVVVGGGVAGLSVAFELLELSRGRPDAPEVVCLESEPRPGGNLRTESAEGYLVEWGPNGFLDNVPATLDLVRRLGLDGAVLPADPASHDRFIFRRDRLRKVPVGPFSFLRSGLLSVPGRLRVFCEPFGPSPPRAPDGGEVDESVLDFAARRIGSEAARVLVSAMVTGVYAGDAGKLSLRATFPKMYRMEREHGTLVRAMLAKRRQARAEGRSAGGPSGPGGRLTSFRGGLEDLVSALARALGPRLRTGVPVTEVSRGPDGRYRVASRGGTEGEAVAADAVVLACPSWAAAKMLLGLDRELSRRLEEVPSASLVVVHAGFDAEAIGGAPRGFGYLIPRGEGPRILGTIWASSIFPGRAPERRVLLTTMVGGAHDPEAVELPDAELEAILRRDLRATMGIHAAPELVRIFRHPRGIPQYTIGHPARLDAMERRLRGLPGLFLAGNSYRGISVNHCVDEAPRTAREAFETVVPGRRDVTVDG